MDNTQGRGDGCNLDISGHQSSVAELRGLPVWWLQGAQSLCKGSVLVQEEGKARFTEKQNWGTGRETMLQLPLSLTVTMQQLGNLCHGN